MQGLNYPRNSDSPNAIKSQSLFHITVSPYSPAKSLELMPSEEETSNIFKSLHMKLIKCQDLESSNTNLDSETSPEKNKNSNINQLKHQMTALTKTFLQYQENIKFLSEEVQYLNNKVVQLKDNMDAYSENAIQKTCKCSCSIY